MTEEKATIERTFSGTYLTPADLSLRWRSEVSLKTLAQWRSRGFGPKFLKLGSSVVYPLKEIIVWETARLKQGTRGA